MKDRKSVNKSYVGKVIQGAMVGAVLCAGATAANAEVTRGFIGPHEYSLPDPKGMKPWNVFVEYSTFQKTQDTWNNGGSRKKSDDVEAFVSLSKFVHFWEVTDSVGIAWELIVPKVSVNNRDTGEGVSGIADLLTGPAFWIKPNENWTLGTDMFFVQVPVGERDLRTTRWNVVASAFWDAQYGKFNYTGNIGTTINGPTERKGAADPANLYYFNNRIGYRVSQLIEPYVGLDYQWQNSKGAAPAAHELAGAVGVMFHLAPNYHLAVHYQGGIEGKNMPVSNNLNVRFAYVF
ncbi:transporter [Aromatoleum toluvorans]|uniref:Transporter n=1 Tax=Aromatoleum toluvorans TaxID=92002 RepID=A0ABX1Q0R6_9RHOO|nr:transporter [Aromatoleum toluvorans]